MQKVVKAMNCLNTSMGAGGTSLIPALGRQKQADICESKANLVYKVNSRIASQHCYTKKLCFKNKTTTTKDWAVGKTMGTILINFLFRKTQLTVGDATLRKES